MRVKIYRCVFAIDGSCINRDCKHFDRHEEDWMCRFTLCNTKRVSNSSNDYWFMNYTSEAKCIVVDQEEK